MGLPWRKTTWVTSLLLIFGLLGSKLFHVLFEARGHRLPDASLAQGLYDLLSADPFHWLYIDEPGFVLYGGLLAGGIVLLRYQEYADLLVRPLSIGIAVGRIDCFLNGCCHGIFGWPTQLAEAVFVLFLGWRVHTLRTWIFGYALWRFGIEFFRADAERGIWALGLSTSQWISLLIAAYLLCNRVLRRQSVSCI